METTNQNSNPELVEDGHVGVSRAARPIIGVIIGTAVLYFGREVLLPLAVATILAVIFSPIADRLEPWLGRLISTALVVLTAIVVAAGIGYFLTVELASVALQMTDYTDNIARKVSAVERSQPAWLQRVENAIKEVENQVQRSQPRVRQRKPTMVQTVPASPQVQEVVKSVLPVLSGVIETLLIIVLLFFMLHERRNLRDRFVRLCARGRITVAAEAIDTAGHAVSHYLFLISVINFAFGVSIGIVLAILGLPNPWLWGVIAFLLRYVPYVGAFMAGLLPTLVAFAVFPGWGKSLEVLGAFIVLDQVSAQFLEPVLVGRGIGVSPVALLVSAMYWAWLWGPAGLLLATPLTTCFKVAGDYLPALGFFSILLGADGKLEDYNDYYRMLLELDESGARALAIRYCNEHGLEATFNDLLIPAVMLAGDERAQNHIPEENERFVMDVTRQLIADLGSRFSKARIIPNLRIFGICAPGEVHNIGLLILLELLRLDGAAARYSGDNQSRDEIREYTRRYSPDVLCISCVSDQSLPVTIELTRELKLDLPNLAIFAGGTAAMAGSNELLKAGCMQVCATKEKARRDILRFAQRRFRLRAVPPPSPATERQPAAAGAEAAPRQNRNI
ncbi:MAG: AI-2E family transporter [Candidatus Binataceae bacterium]|nr:AI-2E family transporter [Candidatus Binataceae bacterium]